MKRALIVVLIALLIASVSGVNGASLAGQREAATSGDAHQQAIAERVRKIGAHRVARIERTDGTTVDALVEAVMADAITVTILEAGQPPRDHPVRGDPENR